MMYHDASGNAVKPLNIDSFDVTQTISLLGVAEIVDMSSRGRSTIKVKNCCVKGFHCKA